MKKLIIVYSNGDKEKIKMSENEYKIFKEANPLINWNAFTWGNTEDQCRGWKFSHIRKFWIEED